MPNRNILFILVDQWPALSFGHRGANISTPHTDRLAAEGTVFTNVFTTCTLCSPARGTLLTGRWPHETGMRDNVGVGYFGKWHLGADGPILRGAHRHSTSFDQGSRSYDPATSPHSYAHAAERYREQRTWLIAGHPPFWGILDVPKEHTAPFQLAAESERFLAEWAGGAKDKPFFLTVSIGPPHFPHYLPREYAERADPSAVELPASLRDDFRGKPDFHARPWWPSMDTSQFDENEWRTVVAFSELHLTLVDEAVGRILDALDAHSLADDTVVVFAADHGDMCGAHNRFDKGPYFYDEVWRIPLIIRAPGAPPAQHDAFVSLLDLGETLLRWVGAPQSAERPRHGRDLTPLIGIRGLTPRPSRGCLSPNSEAAFGVYDLYNGMSFAIRAIRTPTYKYVWNPQSVNELYDLEQDPHELRNLAGDPELVGVEAQLRKRLADWLNAIGDDLPARADDLPAAGTILATNRMGP